MGNTTEIIIVPCIIACHEQSTHPSGNFVPGVHCILLTHPFNLGSVEATDRCLDCPQKFKKTKQKKKKTWVTYTKQKDAYCLCAYITHHGYIAQIIPFSLGHTLTPEAWGLFVLSPSWGPCSAYVLRRMPAYYDVCQRALNAYKLTHNVFDVCQRFRQIFIRRHTLAKSSRCDRALRTTCNY